MTARPLAASLAAVALVLSTAPALAADPAELLRKGVELFNQAEFEASREALRQAAAATRDARLLARAHLYLGLNDAVTGATAAARSQFEVALGHDPELKLDASSFKKELVELFDRVRGALNGELDVGARAVGASVLVDGRQRGGVPYRGRVPIGAHQVEVRDPEGGVVLRARVLVRPRLATQLVAPFSQPARLTVSSAPADAEVILDGARVGTTPLALPVRPGAHRVEVRLQGRPAQLHQIQVAAGQQAALRVRWQEEPARRRGLLLGRTWTWVALAGAACALGAGIGVGVSAQQDFSTWSNGCRGRSDAACLDLRYSIGDRDIAANVLYGVGGGLLVTAAVLFFLESPARQARPSERPPAPQARRPTVHPLLGRVVGGSLSMPF